jgi:hypothetical protein
MHKPADAAHIHGLLDAVAGGPTLQDCEEVTGGDPSARAHVNKVDVRHGEGAVLRTGKLRRSLQQVYPGR